MTALLTADEAARLVPGERLVIVRAGDIDPATFSTFGGAYIAPQDWVALTGPCPTGATWPHRRAEKHEWAQWDQRMKDAQRIGWPPATERFDVYETPCPDCHDGRRIVPLYTEPTCQQPSERGDGTLCGSDYEVTLVDVVRYEGEGESTFFHLPMCYGHRLALGEHVITYEPCSPVLVGRGNIEVVPVTSQFLGDEPKAYLDSHGLWLLNVGNLPPASGPIIKRKHLDPLPVPGRDFGIVIDCVEVAG